MPVVFSHTSLFRKLYQYTTIEMVSQVLFDNKIVSDARLIILRIWNSGNVAITKEEYSRPIKFFFGDKTEVLDAEIVETVPKNINASLTKNLTTVTLEPVLLNPKEVIILKVLLTRYKGKLSVDARIVGTKQEIRSNDLLWEGTTATIAFDLAINLVRFIPIAGSIVGPVIDNFRKEQEAIPLENRRLLTLGLPKEEPDLKKL